MKTAFAELQTRIYMTVIISISILSPPASCLLHNWVRNEFFLYCIGGAVRIGKLMSVYSIPYGRHYRFI